MTPPLAPYQAVTACRSCQASPLEDLIEFGTAPLADRLQDPAAPTPDLHAPLTLCHCPACGLCQIRETVAPEVLFGADYPYFSSVSPALMAHFQQSAQQLMGSGLLHPGDLVVEAASNDGYLLTHFDKAGYRVRGVDPAAGPVAEARRKGVETDHTFFSHAVAQRLRAELGPARLFLANNVLAHVADVNDFVAGIAHLLTEDGMAVIEAPSLLDLVDTGAFDTIYHQHLLYLTLNAVQPLFTRHGLKLIDAEELWVHGGSLRLFVARGGTSSARLHDLLAQEDARQVGTRAFFTPFLNRVTQICTETRAAVEAAQAAGQRLAAYGAAAKGTTLLHMLDVPPGALSHVYDKSPWKTGRAMPGSGLVIHPAGALDRTDVDVVLMLAWNFADEIIAENQPFLDQGGRFLIPVPRLQHVPDTAS